MSQFFKLEQDPVASKELLLAGRKMKAAITADGPRFGITVRPGSAAATFDIYSKAAK
jgi:hypothetical protein